MPSKHAFLSTSKAGRFLMCTPSARLEEKFPDSTSVYAEEGTLAHSLCEAKLLRLLGDKTVDISFAKDDEMEECTEAYKDFIEEELNAAKVGTSDAKLFIEQQLDLSEYIPEGFGTSDAVIISDDMLEVIDFKYGKGVPVNPINNPQLRLYALGAYLALGSLFDFSKIKTTVFQPRIDNVGSEELTIEELLDWAENYVKPRAALAWKGEGEFVVGDHCRFCKAAAVCRARVEEAFTVIDRTDEQPATISDDEIPAILDKLDNAEKWIDAIRSYAEMRAIKNGIKWEGYKLVESITKRKISDELKAAEILEKAGFSIEDITKAKLKGISELEKLLGKDKFNELLKDLVVKPKGAPTLVKETDKRPEVNTIQEAFKEEIE